MQNPMRDDRDVTSVRRLALAVSVAAGLVAFVFFLRFGAVDGLDLIDVLRSLLLLVSTFWLSWGAMLAFVGLTTRARAPDIDRRRQRIRLTHEAGARVDIQARCDTHIHRGNAAPWPRAERTTTAAVR